MPIWLHISMAAFATVTDHVACKPQIFTIWPFAE